jgi:hypothetical protein
MKFSCYIFLPSSDSFSLLGPNIFLGKPLLQYPQAMLFPVCGTPNFTLMKRGKITVLLNPYPSNVVYIVSS